MNSERRNETRVRWRGGTAETSSEIDSAKERVSHTHWAAEHGFSCFASLLVCVNFGGDEMCITENSKSPFYRETLS